MAPFFCRDEGCIDERLFPIEYPVCVEFREKGSPQVLQDIGFVPFLETTPAGGRMRIPIRKISPPGSRLEYPEDPLEDQPIIGSGTTSLRTDRFLGDEGLDLPPLFICQIHDAFAHRIYLRRVKYTKNSRKTNG